MELPELMTQQEVLAYFHLKTASALYKWAHKPADQKSLKPIKIGRKPMYLKQDVVNYVSC